MMHTPFVRDEAKYTTYYLNQAGGELAGYAGARVQYGNGLAGIFRAIYRTMFPLFMRGVKIARPHLTTAAKNIAGDVVSNVTRAAFSKRQDGNGLAVVTKTRKRKPPTTHAQKSKRSRTKRTKTAAKNSFHRRLLVKNTRVSQDIFE